MRDLSSAKDNPLPIVSDGKGNSQSKGVLPETPIAGRNQNSISRSVSTGKVSFRPNNYRRKIIAHDLVNSGLEKIRKCYSSVSCGKHNKLIFVRDYAPIVLQIGKKTITGIRPQQIFNGVKESFDLPPDQILAKAQSIERQIDAAMLDFCKRMEIFGHSDPMSDWHEDGLTGERYIDSLPKDLILQANEFTKLYNEGVEFKGKEHPGVHAERYIKNRIVEDIAPEIALAIDGVMHTLLLMSPLDRAKEKILSWPDDVLRPDVQVLIGGMTAREKELLMEWTFEKFGGRA